MHHRPARVAGAVLAAGAGTRMGGPKADLEVRGQRLLDRAVAVLIGGGCDPVVAVVREGTPVQQVVSVVNHHPERGMRSSLELAVAAADGAQALAVVLVDAPGVGAEAVRWTITAWRPGRIAVATFGGVRGHPIVMSPAMWQDAIAAAEPDEGARRYLAAHHELVDLVAVPGDPYDIDTPGDLVRWQRPGNRPPHRRE